MGGEYSKPAVRPTEHYHKYVEEMPSLVGKVVAITGCTTGTGYCGKSSMASFQCSEAMDMFMHVKLLCSR